MQTDVCKAAEDVLSRVHPELQRFMEEPPGEGYAVIYAGLNLKNGKMYVGQHRHGQEGKSVAETRWKQHMKANGACPAFSGAIKKYGAGAFKCVILDVCPEENADDVEIEAISNDGWDTLPPKGYNLDKGGCGSQRTVSGIEAVRAANKKPEKRQKHSKDAIRQWSDPAFREKQYAGRVAAHARPHVKKRRGNVMKAVWRRQEYREKIAATRIESASRPETIALISAASKKNWQDQAYRENLVSKRREKAKDPDFISKISKNSKSMWECPAYRSKKRAAVLKRRNAILEACKSPEERRLKELQFNRTDRDAKRRSMSSRA
jgi:hypothetical protein